MRHRTISRTELGIAAAPAALLNSLPTPSKGWQNAADRGGVCIAGMGSSFHCALWATWLARQDLELRQAVVAQQSWELLLAPNCPARRSAALLLVSHRGNRGLSREVLSRATRSRSFLLCADQSPSGAIEHSFTGPAETSRAYTSSLFGSIGALSTLLGSLGGKEKLRGTLQQRTLAASYLNNSLQRPRWAGLSGWPKSGGATHWVGGGAFHPIAMELALKTREILHQKTAAYSSEEFLHGPLAAVEKNDFVIVLDPAPHKPARRYSLQERATRVLRASAEVGANTARTDYSSFGGSGRVMNLSPTWQALLALSWGQQIILNLAKSLGIPPDTNRCEDPRYNRARIEAEL